MSGCNDLHQVMETLTQQKEQQIAGLKEWESYPKSHSKLLFHHKDGEQMGRQFVVFTFEVKLIERRSLYVKRSACELR